MPSSGILGAFYCQGADGTPFTDEAATLGADGTTLLVDDTTIGILKFDKTLITVNYDGSPITEEYDIIPGGIKFKDTQPDVSAYTISATPVYIDQCGGAFEWSLDVKREIHDTTEFTDTWEGKTKGVGGWTASFKKWWIDDSFLDIINDDLPIILKFFNEVDEDEAWIGYGWIEGNKLSSSIRGMNEEEGSVIGEGPIAFYDTALGIVNPA